MSQAISKTEKDPDQEFEILRGRHQKLYQEVNQMIQDMTEIQRREYLIQVNKLIDDIKDFIPEIALIDEYIWVNTIALQWQTIFSSILNNSRDIRHEIQSLAAKKNLLAPSSPKVFSRRDVELQAFYLGQNRIIRKLLKNPHLVFQYFPSTPEEKEADWRDACTYLSLDILEGKLDFFSGIQPGLYEALEYAWLEDIKKYKAYFEWEQLDRNWNEEECIRKRYYFNACDQISHRFLDPHSRLPVRCFKNVKSYIESQYFSGGMLDLDKAKKLTVRKAYRQWERNRNSKQIENWRLAEQYVQEFYRNIIPAVEEHDESSIVCLSKLFRWDESSDNLSYLTNCFEAAIFIYFVEAIEI